MAVRTLFFSQILKYSIVDIRASPFVLCRASPDIACAVYAVSGSREFTVSKCRTRDCTPASMSVDSLTVHDSKTSRIS